MSEFRITNEHGEPHYCTYPFLVLAVTSEGLEPCGGLRGGWEVNRVSFKDRSFMDIWRSERFNEVRESIKNGTYEFCPVNSCFELTGDRNQCHTLDELRELFPKIADYIEGKTEEYEGLPIELNTAYDVTCNLRCRSCEVDKLPHYSEAQKRVLQKEVESMGEDALTIFMSGMGEPFASSHHVNWLSAFPHEKFPKLISICLQTNAVLLNETMWNKFYDSIKRYEIYVQISIDGATKDVYELNRTGASFEQLHDNLAFIATLKRSGKINGLYLHYVVQKNNYREIPVIIEQARKYAFDKITLAKITNWGTYTDEEFKEIAIAEEDHPDYDKFLAVYNTAQQKKYNDIDVEFCI